MFYQGYKRTTGEALADLFRSELEQKGIQVEKMLTRGYDGAANISGIRGGVQARIKEQVPKRIMSTVKHII